MRLFGDKRRSKRQLEICLVRYKVSGSQKIGEGELANIRDMSEHGISMRTSEPLAIRSKISLKINLPSSQEPMPVEGEVRRCRRVFGTHVHRVGVEFVEITDSDRAKIKGYLESFKKK